MSLATVKHFALSSAFLAVLLLNESLSAHSSHKSDIAGIYATYGFDPYLDTKFEGTMVISTSENNIHQFEWTYVGGSVNSGTGIYDKEEKVIAVTFIDPNDTSYIGPQLFKVNDNKLTSQWALLGQSLKGTETAVKIHEE